MTQLHTISPCKTCTVLIHTTEDNTALRDLLILTFVLLNIFLSKCAEKHSVFYVPVDL